MRTIVEFSTFSQQVKAVWNEAEYEAFTFWLAQNPEAGEVIPGTRGARKVRWRRPGTGKSGGVRVIYSISSLRSKLFLWRFMPSRRVKACRLMP